VPFTAINTMHLLGQCNADPSRVRARVRGLHNRRAVELLKLDMSEGRGKVVRITERAEHWSTWLGNP
jgi:hypothetical protein